MSEIYYGRGQAAAAVSFYFFTDDGGIWATLDSTEDFGAFSDSVETIFLTQAVATPGDFKFVNDQNPFLRIFAG
tara:strand:- start:2600 stop:2821 length:222 start_codon:yes stop_codon:yes gene_type:complete